MPDLVDGYALCRVHGPSAVMRQAMKPQPAGAPMRTRAFALFIVIGTPPLRSWSSIVTDDTNRAQVGFV
jgi:hypothetical protein